MVPVSRLATAIFPDPTRPHSVLNVLAATAQFIRKIGIVRSVPTPCIIDRRRAPKGVNRLRVVLFVVGVVIGMGKGVGASGVGAAIRVAIVGLSGAGVPLVVRLILRVIT